MQECSFPQQPVGKRGTGKQKHEINGDLIIVMCEEEMCMFQELIGADV